MLFAFFPRRGMGVQDARKKSKGGTQIRSLGAGGLCAMFRGKLSRGQDALKSSRGVRRGAK